MNNYKVNHKSTERGFEIEIRIENINVLINHEHDCMIDEYSKDKDQIYINGRLIYSCTEGWMTNLSGDCCFDSPIGPNYDVKPINNESIKLIKAALDDLLTARSDILNDIEKSIRIFDKYSQLSYIENSLSKILAKNPNRSAIVKYKDELIAAIKDKLNILEFNKFENKILSTAATQAIFCGGDRETTKTMTGVDILELMSAKNTYEKNYIYTSDDKLVEFRKLYNSYYKKYLYEIYFDGECIYRDKSDSKHCEYKVIDKKYISEISNSKLAYGSTRGIFKSYLECVKYEIEQNSIEKINMNKDFDGYDYIDIALQSKSYNKL